ncbi:MAG: signal peptidase I [Thaumarchaeota archaeon]|jgi:signal peptidase I|nr:signal peptidase I [Nitrososphaerales archaeon]NSL75599.1 signal peptidase I [Nitrososphaerota archaeon]NSL77471.1 signal peptidase I [Nitrososphaerota archaeon]PBO81474.1 MAG: signal peptidase I [Euryarchaeota archaeon]
MRKNQAILLTIIFVLGIFTGLMTDLVGLSSGESDLEKELNLANENIKWLNENITSMREAERTKFIRLNLRLGELSNLIAERRGVWITTAFENDAPVYYDSNVVTIAQIICGTDSMRPTFDCSDKVIVYEPEFNHINERDIIIFKERLTPLCNRYTGERIIHRIIEVQEMDGEIVFETKGDGNNLSDNCLVKFEDITYKVIGIIYDGKI